jgi:hypothetical protein
LRLIEGERGGNRAAQTKPGQLLRIEGILEPSNQADCFGEPLYRAGDKICAQQQEQNPEPHGMVEIVERQKVYQRGHCGTKMISEFGKAYLLGQKGPYYRRGGQGKKKGQRKLQG